MQLPVPSQPSNEHSFLLAEVCIVVTALKCSNDALWGETPHQCLLQQSGSLLGHLKVSSSSLVDRHHLGVRLFAKTSHCDQPFSVCLCVSHLNYIQIVTLSSGTSPLQGDQAIHRSSGAWNGSVAVTAPSAASFSPQRRTHLQPSCQDPLATSTVCHKEA